MHDEAAKGIHLSSNIQRSQLSEVLSTLAQEKTEHRKDEDKYESTVGRFGTINDCVRYERSLDLMNPQVGFPRWRVVSVVNFAERVIARQSSDIRAFEDYQ